MLKMDGNTLDSKTNKGQQLTNEIMLRLRFSGKSTLLAPKKTVL